MARIKIDLPAHFSYQTELPIRITDLNYGGHLGNDALLSLLHEARVQFLKQHGYSELDVAGAGVIMSDVGIVYKGEGFYGDVLTVQVQATEFSKYGFDLVYLLLNQNGKEIAQAKTGMLCFDYQQRKLRTIPAEARERLETKA
ncbi:acyl-CoA thioesterase [Rufibacter glacialis]|uniref:Thioesterase n=1 Tax=Rufibacter glacialis TaxID=1259555 RepID=A0A5M8QSE9_9BACT|nr:thioesterase family protein [Rufibacter glacialis]KAA6437122.1 thioesterase [Rufibacter glacialis]GGK61890.1 thioesterase [Rufibacter glacialis]